MVSPDTIAALPFRALEKSTKNVVIELAGGERFLILGGENRRPLKKGVAGFTPKEIMHFLNEGLGEQALKDVIKLKEQFGPGTYFHGVEEPDAKQ